MPIITDNLFHRRDGVSLPRVTAITAMYPMGYGLKTWLANSGSMQEADRIKNEAAARGSRVHGIVGDLLQGGEINYSPELDYLWSYLEGFANFWETEKLSENLADLQVERFMWNEKIGTAGSADLVVGDTIIDFKTSTSVQYPEYALQIDAYRRLAEAEDHKKYNRLWLVQLGSNTKRGYSIKEIKDSRKDLKTAFEACKLLFYREHGAEPKDKILRDQIKLNLI